jgi:hypothetical protein
MAIGKWENEDAQKDVDFMRIVRKWANVLREVIVPLTENAPWCSDATPPYASGVCAPLRLPTARASASVGTWASVLLSFNIEVLMDLYMFPFGLYFNWLAYMYQFYLGDRVFQW